jgi:hypothetical protein
MLRVGRLQRVSGFATRFAAMRLPDIDVDLIFRAIAALPIASAVRPRQRAAIQDDGGTACRGTARDPRPSEWRDNPGNR